MRKPLITLMLCFATAAGVAAERSDQSLTPVEGRPPAPELDLLDMEGVRHRMADYRGKVVIVNFWATWCPPCREEMPSMQRAYEQLREEGIEMLAVNIGENEDIIFAFTANYPVEFPLLLDLDSATIQNWPVRGLPTTFVVDPQGRLAYRAIGGRAWDDPDLLAPVRRLKD
ncbi:MAG: TlpA disulfide reductase family protein [Gammaproteobacteria bacterium]|nr:TlpA disulfide reductase family protein [Gammaproteobacteria bacterium]